MDRLALGTLLFVWTAAGACGQGEAVAEVQTGSEQAGGTTTDDASATDTESGSGSDEATDDTGASSETSGGTDDTGQSSETSGGTDDTGQSSETSGSTDDAVLEHYVPVSDPFHVVESGSDNLSSITWNPDTATYFVLIDAPQTIFEFEDDLLTKRRDVTLLGGENYEGIVYLGDDQYAVASEESYLSVVTIGVGDTTTGEDQRLVFAPPPDVSNMGAEGVAYDPDVGAKGRFWVVQEKSPLRIYQFDRPVDGADHSHDVDLEVTEPFDPAEALPVSEMSDVAFDPRTGRLIVCSHDDSRLVEVDPATGQVWGVLVLPEQINGYASKWEAVAFGPGYQLALGSESMGDTYNRGQLYDYRP